MGDGQFGGCGTNLPQPGDQGGLRELPLVGVGFPAAAVQQFVLSRLPVVPGAALRGHRRRRGAPEALPHGLGSQTPAQEIRLSYRQGEPVAADAAQGDLQAFRPSAEASGGNREDFFTLWGPQAQSYLFSFPD